ncbi:phosphonate ABC transporter, permease protein PhnE [Mucilaginibacter celer]|uniref:Phosphonate ABC transporter, permease protein PhnE n=1 Tax=Mucilaginibacter celer TaxID=2305508 RepID=A0A494VI23_9SPHI|nr:phosphonate ABC transporter, permease protein PhnE [Mucilaginibacter celer]AYL94477.1 phosphonate ABC transporter, permease protein PhnE [Mucilaginibacter celer]
MIIGQNTYSFKRYRKFVLPLISLIIVTAGASFVCDATLFKLRTGILKGLAFLRFMAPPDWTAFKDMLEPALQSMLLALLGTVFGTILSVIFAMLAASNISNKWVRNTARVLIALERSVPEIIILLLLIAAFGLGATPGIISLSLGCIGMLGKLLADIIEEIDPVLIESMESLGANKMQIIWFGVIPQIIPNLISYALFRLEINIRLSVIMGAIGAGGIGYELDYSFSMLQYHRAFTAMIVVIVMIFGTERLSYLLRKKFKVEGALQ